MFHQVNDTGPFLLDKMMITTTNYRTVEKGLFHINYKNSQGMLDLQLTTERLRYAAGKAS